MNDHKINFILEAHKILSVNSLYAAKLVYGPRGPIPTIYKSGESKKVESYIKEQVSLLNIPQNYPWVNKNTLFKMDIMVIFKSGYLLRDLDNTLLIWGILIKCWKRISLNQQNSKCSQRL